MVQSLKNHRINESNMMVLENVSPFKYGFHITLEILGLPHLPIL